MRRGRGVASLGISRGPPHRPGEGGGGDGGTWSLHAAALCVSTKKTTCRLCKKPPRQRRFSGGFSNCEYLAIFVERNLF
jgi:hypothetical protein